MAVLLTSAQMRAIEEAAISSGDVSGLELMERAGQGVVDAVFVDWPELAPAAGGDRGASPSSSPECFDKGERDRRAVVLCGPGNNGGDGFVVARLLAQLGWAVEVFLYGVPDRLPADARVNYERWVAIGGVRPLRMADIDLRDADLAVDALFGTGLTRPLEGEALLAANALATRAFGDDPVVAVDAPSGMCMDSGRPLAPPQGDGVAAAGLTVSFHALKLGHVLADGPERCGHTVVADIGLDRRLVRDLGRRSDPENRIPADHSAIASLCDGSDLRPGYSGEESILDKGYAGSERHKYGHGHALILAGGPGRGGAARLAARGALRVGAGLVTLGPPHAALAENAGQLNAVMLAEIEDAATLRRILQDDRLNALALGPGLGAERARDLVPAALEAGRATVLDADALTAFAHDPDTLFGMLHDTCVLTPHAGEFARLFPDIAARLAGPATRGPAYSKVDAARDAASRSGCTVLFKGTDTVIADQKGHASVHAAHRARAAPWLATAGSGDVLTGLIAGLLARGRGPRRSAETAAWLHVEAARIFGPGLIAEDLPEALPKVFKSLGL